MHEEKDSQKNPEENLFEKMENASTPQIPVKRFQKSGNNVIIAGVCSGIADYLNADTASIRIIALLSLLFGGWSAVAYLLTAFLLPAEHNLKQLTPNEKEIIKKENFRTVVSGLLILTGFHFALLMFGIGSPTRIFIFPNFIVFPISAIAFGVYLLMKHGTDNRSLSENYPVKYFRSKSDRKLMGVCGGLAKYINIDSSTLRIILIIATLLTLGIIAVLYVFLSISTQFETE